MTAIITGHTCSIGAAIKMAVPFSGSGTLGWSRSTGTDVLSAQLDTETVPTDTNLVVHCAETGPEGLQRVWGKVCNTLEENSGAFIYLSSVEAVLSAATPYARSKIFQEAMLPDMVSWSPRVRVNCLRLGHVIGTGAWPQGSPVRPEQFLKRYVTVDEIAEAVLFLANCRSITGQIVTVDSGITLLR